MLAGKTLRDFIGSVCASIFDDPYVRFIILLVEKSKDLLQSGWQAFFLVMGRDDDG
jgi:hypothetical protein